MRLAIAVAAVALTLPALAQAPGAPQGALPPGADPAALAKPLPERKDVVSWKLLAQVELVKAKDRYVAKFHTNVSALDSKDVKLQGFMVPLEMGDQQTHFILAALPQTCAFCLPGGPEQMVEVKTKAPVKYTFDPVVLSGKLAVLADDPTGVYYRLTDAQHAK